MAGIKVREASVFKHIPVQYSYDKENQRPVIRSSICTGEQVAGFKDVRTGRFTEVMVIRDGKDMEEFTAKYDIPAEDIKKEW